MNVAPWALLAAAAAALAAVAAAFAALYSAHRRRSAAAAEARRAVEEAARRRRRRRRRRRAGLRTAEIDKAAPECRVVAVGAVTGLARAELEDDGSDSVASGGSESVGGLDGSVGVGGSGGVGSGVGGEGAGRGCDRGGRDRCGDDSSLTFAAVASLKACEEDLSEAVSSAAAAPSCRGTLATIALAAGDDTCAVCLDDVRLDEIVRRLPCSHVFHSPCIRQWLRRKNACPCCCARVVKKRRKDPRPAAPRPAAMPEDVEAGADIFAGTDAGAGVVMVSVDTSPSHAVPPLAHTPAPLAAAARPPTSSTDRLVAGPGADSRRVSVRSSSWPRSRASSVLSVLSDGDCSDVGAEGFEEILHHVRRVLRGEVSSSQLSLAIDSDNDDGDDGDIGEEEDLDDNSHRLASRTPFAAPAGRHVPQHELRIEL